MAKRSIKLHSRTEGLMAPVCVLLETAERLLTDVIAVWQDPDKTVLECLKDLNRIIADLKGAKDCP